MRISDWSSDVCSSDLHDEERVLAQQAREAAQHHEGEEAKNDEAGDEAHFLAGDGEDEVGVGVWQLRLHGALAGTAAEQAAVHEGLQRAVDLIAVAGRRIEEGRSEEHTSELQSLMRISYAVFCLKKKNSTTR